jgi:protein CpxP
LAGADNDKARKNMKTNKLAVLMAFALGVLAVAANAQDKPANENRPARNREQVRERGSEIARELNLSPEQKSKFEAVMREAAEKRKALREDTNLTPEQRREKMKSIAEESRTKLKEILTAEQLAKWEEMQKNRPGAGSRKAPEPPKK